MKGVSRSPEREVDDADAESGERSGVEPLAGSLESLAQCRYREARNQSNRDASAGADPSIVKGILDKERHAQEQDEGANYQQHATAEELLGIRGCRRAMMFYRGRLDRSRPRRNGRRRLRRLRLRLRLFGDDEVRRDLRHAKLKLIEALL